MNKITDADYLASILPSSIAGQEVFQDAAAAYTDDDTKQHLTDGQLYARLDELSGAVLDHLAAQWHAAVWRDSWPDKTKRKVLRTLVALKSITGTKASIMQALGSLGGVATIKEWFECVPQATPHTFQIIIDQSRLEGVAEGDLLEDVQRLIEIYKPVRSQYTMSVTDVVEAPTLLTPACRCMSFRRVTLDPVTMTTVDGTATLTSAPRPASFRRIQNF